MWPAQVQIYMKGSSPSFRFARPRTLHQAHVPLCGADNSAQAWTPGSRGNFLGKNQRQDARKERAFEPRHRVV